jgi:subtilisin family serine protease
MNKLDPDLLRIAERHRERVAGRTAALRPAALDLFVEFGGPIGDLIACGFEADTVLGGAAHDTTIATGRIPGDALDHLVAIEHVIRVEGAVPAEPLLNRSLGFANIAPLHTQADPVNGAGVVIGVIDSEIDIFHPAFRTDDGRTRILGLWNQSLEATGAGTTRQYGVEYDATAINGFLTNPALAATEMRGADTPLGGTTFAVTHGTGVAGIAAGNGAVDGKSCLSSGERKYVGVAPEADLIVVAMPTRLPGTPPPGYEGVTDIVSSKQILDGLNYIFLHPSVNGRAVVVNISMGVRRGPRDGSSLLDEGVDRLLTNNGRYLPGRAVVVASGNEAARNQHTSGVVTAGESLPIRFTVAAKPTPAAGDADDADEDFDAMTPASSNRLQVWCEKPPPGTVLKASLGTTGIPDMIGLVVAGGSGTMTVEGKDVHLQVVEHAGKLCVDIEWAAGDADWSARTWMLLLKSEGDADIAFDAWLDSRTGTISLPVPTPGRTVTSPATARTVIAVGSHRNRQDDVIATSSSFGPTTDGRPKPDVVAPGAGVVSAHGKPASGGRVRPRMGDRCCQFCWDGYEVTVDSISLEFRSTTGTSFAAPHVTGLVALMFEVKRDLDADQIRDILRRTAIPPAGVAAGPDEPPYGQWGWGKLNGTGAMARVRALGPGGGGGGQLAGAGRRQSATGDGDEDAGPEDSGNDQGAAEDSMTSTSRTQERLAAGQHTGDGGGLVSGPRLPDQLSASPWAAMVSRHFSEVRGLINHRRRVALYWQRIGGPALVRGLVQQIGQPALAPRPPAPDPDRFARYLDLLLGELSRLGSTGLRRDVERYRPLLAAVDPVVLVSVMAGAFSATETAA